MVTVGAPQPDGSRSFKVGASKLDFLPILFSPETLSDETLRHQILRHCAAFGAVALDLRPAVQKSLVRCWAKDLKQIGNILPPGKPNSVKTGIHRGNGLTYGGMAMAIRDNEQLRRVWQLLAAGLGRTPPFGDGAAQPVDFKSKVLTSFDGILFTGDDHDFKGLKSHRDVYPPPLGECGQLQAVTYVHPPPPKRIPLGPRCVVLSQCSLRRCGVIIR